MRINVRYFLYCTWVCDIFISHTSVPVHYEIYKHIFLLDLGCLSGVYWHI